MIVCVLQARDPIPQFRKYALEAGLMTEADVKELEKSVNEEVEEAVKFADESPKPVGSFPTVCSAPLHVDARRLHC